jgi:hypothetical protein
VARQSSSQATGTLFPHCAFFKRRIEKHAVSEDKEPLRCDVISNALATKGNGHMPHRKNFTPSDDALILEQPVNRMGSRNWQHCECHASDL